MKDKIKGFISGVMLTGCVSAFASVGWKTVSINYNNIKVNYEGKQMNLTEEPFTLNGRTYIPLRSLMDDFGMGVSWDDATKTVNLYDDPAMGDGNPTAPPAGNTSEDIPEEAKKVMELTNEYRAQNGLTPLKWDDSLAEVAKAHSDDMSARNYFSHNTPEGLSPFDRMKNYGISYMGAAENIAQGYLTPQSVVNGWINSEGHRKNMLGNYEYIGVGYCASGNYWTQLFKR